MERIRNECKRQMYERQCTITRDSLGETWDKVGKTEVNKLRRFGHAVKRSLFPFVVLVRINVSDVSERYIRRFLTIVMFS